jgi:hypothetical protein
MALVGSLFPIVGLFIIRNFDRTCYMGVRSKYLSTNYSHPVSSPMAFTNIPNIPIELIVSEYLFRWLEDNTSDQPNKTNATANRFF